MLLSGPPVMSSPISATPLEAMGASIPSIRVRSTPVRRWRRSRASKRVRCVWSSGGRDASARDRSAFRRSGSPPIPALADVAIRGQISALRGRIATESGGDVLGSSDRQRGDGQGRWRGACGDEAPAPHQIEV